MLKNDPDSANQVSGKGAMNIDFNMNYKKRYLALGSLLGVSIAVMASIFELLSHQGSITFWHLLNDHFNNPLLWIIDFTLLLIICVAWLLGNSQDIKAETIRDLEEKFDSKTKEIKQVNKRLENVIADMADLVFVLDNEGMIEKINHSVLSILGFQEHDLLGKSLSCFIGEANFKKVILKDRNHLFEEGYLRLTEIVCKTAYGHDIELSNSVSYIWDDYGNQGGIICVAQDITKKKQKEALLIKEKEKYETLFNNAPLPIVIVRDAHIIFNNREMENLFGYRTTDFNDKPFQQFIYPEDRHQVIDAQNRQPVQGQPQDLLSFRVVTKAGEIRWIDLKSTEFTWDEKPASLCYIIDNTERRRMLSSLEKNEKQYRELVQTINVIIVKTDNQLRFTFLNKYGQEFFGYQEEEVLGKSFLETIIPKMDSTGRDLEEQVNQYLENPELFSLLESETIRKNGERAWVAWRNKAIYNENGNLQETLGMGYDITKRIEAERKLTQKSNELEGKVKELNFLYGISQLMDPDLLSIEELLQDVAESIPGAFRYSKAPQARLVFDQNEYSTANFVETQPKISEGIYVNQTQRGKLEICYKPDVVSDCEFREGEINLTKTVAEELGRTIERIELRQALLTSENMYRTLFDNAPIPLAVSQEKKFVFMNQKAEMLYEMSLSEIASKSYTDFVVEEDKQLAMEFQRNPAMSLEESQTCRYRLVTKSGRIKWIETMVVPYTWENKPATLSFQTDITNQLAYENKIKRQNHELEFINNLMIEELEQARLTQLALLPSKLPELPNTQLVVKYSPMAQIGGDFYDLFLDQDNNFGIMVGDVTGHGIPAALLSFMFLAVFKNTCQGISTPDDVMKLTNSFLAGKLPGGKYASMFYCLYNPTTHILTYSCAGHPPGLLIRPESDRIIRLQTKGMVVGMFEEPPLPFEAAEIELYPGDKVLLFTDGLLEITDQQDQMQDSRLLEDYFFSRKRQPIGKLLDDIFEYCSSKSKEGQFNDDVTMIGLEIF